MKNVDLKKVLGILGAVLRCPICGCKYNLDAMKVIENERDEFFGEAHIVVHSDCKKCQGSVMFTIGVLGPEVVSSASVTDLTLADTHRFREIAPLTSNDVLTVHTSIQEFDGDFEKAFGE